MSGGFESLGRIRFQGLALLAVAFLTGLLAGIAGDRVFREPPEPAAEMRVPWGRPGMLPPFFDRLDLSQDQRRRIREILERYRPRTDSVVEAMLPRLRVLTDSARMEIREVLTEEQRERLERELPPRMRGRFDSFRRVPEGRRPPPPR